MSTTDTKSSQDALAALRIPRSDERRRSGFGRFVKWGIGLTIVCGLAIGGAVIAHQQGAMPSVSEFVPRAIRSLPEVRTSKAIVETGRRGDAVVVATGYLESRRQAQIGARGAGRIEVIHVEEGSRVAKGDIIAILEHKDLDAALAAMRATRDRSKADLGEHEVEIARTKADFDRAEKLQKTRSITETEFDRAKFAYEGAVARKTSLQAAIVLSDARVQEAEQFRENMIVRAPFDGTIISKDAEVGESILPGGMGEASGRGSVVTIADLDHLEVDCDVKEDFISRVIVEGPAEVSVDAVPDRRYRGRVRKIIPMGDRARATIKVKVEIIDSDARLFPNMSSTVYFLPDEGAQEQEAAPERRIFCDRQAIQSSADGEYVWIVDADGRARRRDVQTEENREGRVEIVDGLDGGETLILSPPDEIHDGMEVKPRE